MTFITTIEDLRVLAQKRVPRMFYDYADSGSWTESTYRANEKDFERILLRQRVAVNMENRSTRTGTTSPTASTSTALRGAGVACSGWNSRAQDMVEKGTAPCAPGASSIRASRGVTATTIPP